MSAIPESPKRTPLYDLHREFGAKFVPFAGYDMPVQYAAAGYPSGVIAEHLHTRTKAGLFDVSHMGQVKLIGATAAEALETLVPGDIAALAEGRIRYTLLTNEAGGVRDDLMVTRMCDHLFLIVNAAMKDEDIAHIGEHIGGDVDIVPLPEKALLALQGPSAAAVLGRIAPEAAALPFMAAAALSLGGVSCLVSRSGYTGEDGFEISASAGDAERLARLLLGDAEVALIGLGARDSLRLEAGLCLYGHDLDTETTPIEADLAWTISKRRRAEGGFPGAGIVQKQLRDGPARRRVGIQPLERAPAREGTRILIGGEIVGHVTSGGFSPSTNAAISMGYIAREHAAPGTEVSLLVRDVARPARLVALPFVPHRYHR